VVKKYSIYILLAIFSLFLVSNTFAAKEGLVTIPEDKDIEITFSGFQEITLNTNHTTNILLKFREGINKSNALLQIKEINDNNVLLNVFVNNEDRGNFTLLSGQDQTINLTKKTPFLVTNTYVFNKDGVYRAQIGIRMPFVQPGDDIGNIGVPESKIIDQLDIKPLEDKEDGKSLSLKILLAVIIVLIIALIIISRKLRK